MLCTWWDQLSVGYYELLKPNETITGTFFQIQLMRLNLAFKDTCTNYYSRCAALCSCIIMVGNLLGNIKLETLNPPAVFIRHYYLPEITEPHVNVKYILRFLKLLDVSIHCSF